MDIFQKLLRENAVIGGMIDELVAKAKLYKDMLKQYPEKEIEIKHKSLLLETEIQQIVKRKNKFAKKAKKILSELD